MLLRVLMHLRKDHGPQFLPARSTLHQNHCSLLLPAGVMEVDVIYPTLNAVPAALQGYNRRMHGPVRGHDPIRVHHLSDHLGVLLFRARKGRISCILYAWWSRGC